MLVRRGRFCRARFSQPPLFNLREFLYRFRTHSVAQINACDSCSGRECHFETFSFVTEKFRAQLLVSCILTDFLVYGSAVYRLALEACWTFAEQRFIPTINMQHASCMFNFFGASSASGFSGERT